MRESVDNGLLAVQRAIGELRLARPLLLRDGDDWLLLAAAELIGADTLAAMERWAGRKPRLALTRSRGQALNIRPGGGDMVFLEPSAWLDPATMRTLADATTDLEMPFRGPFERELRPPSGGEKAAIQLVKLAKLLPAAVLIGIGGKIVSDLQQAQDLLIVTAQAVAAYETEAAHRLRSVIDAHVPLAEAEQSRLVAFRPDDGRCRAYRHHRRRAVDRRRGAGAPAFRMLHRRSLGLDEMRLRRAVTRRHRAKWPPRAPASCSIWRRRAAASA